MNKQQLVRGFAISTVSLLGLLLSNSIFSADLASAGGKRANQVGSSSEGRGPFRRMGRRTLITAPTWQRKMTLARCTPVSW